MTRPILKKKKSIHKRRRLIPLQRKIVAKEMLSGKPIKQIAADWKISRTYAARIFAEHLEYRIEWRSSAQVEATA